jgi:hypothetical protein
MPQKTPAITATGKTGEGRSDVGYRDGNGKVRDAIIIGPGSSSGAKLKLGVVGGANGIKDNVAGLVNRNDTGVFVYRSQ